LDDFRSCEALRARLSTRDDEVGDVFEADGRGQRVTVAAEAALASSPPWKGALLYHLVRGLRPTRVVEFGTCFGVSASYLAAALRANGVGQLFTIEGSPSRHRIAEESIESVAPGVSMAICGRFDDHLDLLDAAELFFLDGNHWEEPTLRYVREAARRSSRPALMVIDDVAGYSEEMSAAWHRLRREGEFSGQVLVHDVGMLWLGAVDLWPLTKRVLISRAQTLSARAQRALTSSRS
jgi:predicted O-methyltransferase YrrM